jgi:hypothetical protein
MLSRGPLRAQKLKHSNLVALEIILGCLRCSVGGKVGVKLPCQIGF